MLYMRSFSLALFLCATMGHQALASVVYDNMRSGGNQVYINENHGMLDGFTLSGSGPVRLSRFMMHFYVRPPQRPPFDIEIRFYDGLDPRQTPVNSGFVGSVRTSFVSTVLGVQTLDLDLSGRNFVLSDNVGCVSFHSFYTGTSIPGPNVFPVANYGMPGPWIGSSSTTGWIDYDDNLSFDVRERRFFGGPLNFSMLIEGSAL